MGELRIGAKVDRDTISPTKRLTGALRFGHIARSSEPAERPHRGNPRFRRNWCLGNLTRFKTLQNYLNGVEKQDLARPDVYPKDGCYPTTYTIRELDDADYAVVMENLEEHSP